ncbi:MAG: ATP-binding region ATPase domain protein [Segetibacter sp.]|nr:ATP-binding region ATPase domain protein [Segetibacter sp.]
MSIKITDKITISKIEDYFDLLYIGDQEIDLIIPVSIYEYDVGTKGLFCQFLNLWVRKTKTSSIIVEKDGSTGKKEFIDKFINNVFSLSLILMTIKENRKILDENDNDLTIDIRKAALFKIKESSPKIINRTKAFEKGSGIIAEFCFDHAEYAENKLNRWFYQPGVEEPLPESGFKSFYNAAIEHLLLKNYQLRNKATNNKIAEELTGIIKELFDNTHFHAREGFFKIPLIPNIRGVLIEIHHGSLEYFKSKTEIGNQPHFRYFFNPSLFENDYEIKTFLEISVIDSGIGYSQMATGTKLALINNFIERQNVIGCLTKYDRTSRKRGLKRVAHHLTERKGFFMLRTGRLNLYRNFIEKPYLSGDYLDPNYEIESGMKSFLFWEDDAKDVSNLSEACGSLITILLPID